MNEREAIPTTPAAPAVPETPGHESTFEVPGMDCPSEVQQIRMALDGVPGLQDLHCDLERRTVVVRHRGAPGALLERLAPLGFGARLQRSVPADVAGPTPLADPKAEARVLKQLLVINATMFFVEVFLGVLAQSTGLLADSVDMFADAAVYGMSLLAVGRPAQVQRRAARLSGWLQLVLALGVLSEVVRRAIAGSEPVEALMIGVALVALLANLTCIALLARHREGGLHLKASWIFSTNDAIANLGVICAGVLVAITGAPWPDLAIGTVVGGIVLWGAVRILRLR